MRAVFFLFAALLVAQQMPHDDDAQLLEPYRNDPQAVEQGKKLYLTSCSGCHGPNAEGGRGPNLADGRQVRRASNRELFVAIQKGVPGTDMPASPLEDQKIWLMVNYLRSLTQPAYLSQVPGDPSHGEGLFFGQAGCSQCHSVAGRGGSLGPDLPISGCVAVRLRFRKRS